VTLAPDFFAVENSGNVALLLFFGAPVDQGRTSNASAHEVGDLRHLRSYHLLAIDRLFHHRRTTTTVGFRPVNPDPSRMMQLFLPVELKSKAGILIQMQERCWVITVERVGL